MKIIGSLLFIITSFVGTINPLLNYPAYSVGTNNVIHVNSIGRDQSLSELPKTDRYYEEEGGFSYIPPDGWTLMEIPGLKYKVVYGPLMGNFAPNINFLPEQYPGSIDDYLSYNLDAISKMFTQATLISKEPFTTDAGIMGYKIVITNYLNGNDLHQAFYLLDGGVTKYSIAYSRLTNKGMEFDNRADETARSFQIYADCANSLSGDEFEKAYMRIAFSLPKGWKTLEGLSTVDNKSFVKNQNRGSIVLIIMAFDTNISPRKCLIQRMDFLQQQLYGRNTSLDKINISPDEYKIDGKLAAFGIAQGNTDPNKSVPVEADMLGISSENTVFLFTFIASGFNKEQAETAISDLEKDLSSFVKTIQID